MLEVTCVGCGAQLFTHLICEDCRRHIEIGKLIEAMPKNSFLQVDAFGDWTHDPDFEDADRKMIVGKTPLEALTKGRKP